MSESKHTPAPWFIDSSWGPTDSHPDWRAIVSCFDDGCHRMSVSGHIGEANARLIAAAPDLLEALELAVEVIEATGPAAYHDAERQIRAAITKAKGGQP